MSLYQLNFIFVVFSHLIRFFFFFKFQVKEEYRGTSDTNIDTRT